MSLTITNIIAEYGAYYLGDKTNMERLFTQLFAPTNFASALKPMDTKGNTYQGSIASMSEVLQAFQKAFTAKGGATFEPCPNNLFKVKADLAEYPDELDGQWTAFLRNEKINRADWPFVRWWMEQLVVPRYRKDLDRAQYTGVYVAPTPGTAGNAVDSMNGMRYFLNYHVVTSGRMTSITTGTPDTDPEVWYDQLIDWYDTAQAAYPELIGEMPFINMSPTLLQRAKRGYNKKFKQSPDMEKVSSVSDETFMKLDSTPVSLRGLEAMRGSNKIWMPVDGNALDLSWMTKGAGEWSLETEDRKVKIWTDQWKGVGMAVPEWCVTNEQTV